MFRTFVLATMLAGLALSLTAGAGRAHDPGLSYADIRVDHGRLTAHLTFARRDIETLVAIDADRDGTATPDELADVMAPLTAVAARALSVHLDDAPLPGRLTALRLDDSDAVHLELTFPPPTGKTLRVAVPLIARLGSGHRQFVTVQTPRWTLLAEHLLDGRRAAFELPLASLPPPDPQAGWSLRSAMRRGLERLGVAYARP